MGKPKFKIYTDGSYRNGVGAWSFVVVDENLNKEVYSDNGKVLEKNLLAMNNVGGEILAALKATEFAHENNMDITLYHDYLGIAHWITGVWKTKKPATHGYKSQMLEYMKNISVKFKHVPGHSGDTFNDRADRLAKDALCVD